MDTFLPLGKLPPELLQHLIEGMPVIDQRVLLGAGLGLDCAVIDVGHNLLVFKSDPITFATHQIGWYAVQVNANDIVTTGAKPVWFLVTALLPEAHTTPHLVEEISHQIQEACSALSISVIGGHTEITQGIERPIIVGTMIGEVERDRLITPKGARPGDRIILTKSIPIEATSILSREFSTSLLETLSATEIEEAKNYLYQPGISIVRDAQIAMKAGKVHAMHDPTEGGIVTALWEMTVACGYSFVIDMAAIPVSSLSGKVCENFRINPYGAIASGALLMTVSSEDALIICRALETENIPAVEIGIVGSSSAGVWQLSQGQLIPLLRFPRDEVARVLDKL